ncbi:MAG: M28 family peptidase, partial [Terricaulis sp.]
RGPAIFFESNQPNADAAAAFGAAPRPIANSVMADVYALLSNSSDVTALTRPGLDILNIAVLDGLEDYHTPQDNIASQDLRSVQHMGDVALAVTRRLAQQSDADVATPMVYTDIASRAFIAVPSWVGQAALLICALIAAFALWRAEGPGRWSALATPIATIVIAGVVSFGIGFALSILRPGEEYGFAHPEPTRAWCILSALLAAALALFMLRPNRSTEQTAAAAMLWFATIGGALSLFLPGISILFALPSAVFAVSVLAALAWKPAQAVGAWLAAIVALAVWGPLLFLIELALGFEMPFALAVIAGMMILPWLGVLAHMRGEGRWRELAAVTALALVISVTLSALAPSMSEARPRSLNITYFLNTTDNEARVLAGSAERALPEGLVGAFSAERILPGDRFDTWAVSTPAEQVAPPALQDLSVAHENGAWIVRGRLVMNGAYRAILRMPTSAQQLHVRMNDVLTDFADTGGEPGDFMNLACQGRACDGATVEITLGAQPADDWYMIGQFPGRTTPASNAFRARRGPTATPIQAGDGTTTLSRFRPE